MSFHGCGLFRAQDRSLFTLQRLYHDAPLMPPCFEYTILTMQMALKLSEIDVGGRWTAFPEVSHRQEAPTPLPPPTKEAAISDPCEGKDEDEVEQQLRQDVKEERRNDDSGYTSAVPFVVAGIASDLHTNLESLKNSTPSGDGGAGAGYGDQATGEGSQRAHTDTSEPRNHGVGWVEEVAVCEAAHDGTAERDGRGLVDKLAQATTISLQQAAEQQVVGAAASGENEGAEQETEEAMMARVIAESIWEQERLEKQRVESERLELEQVSDGLRRFG